MQTSQIINQLSSSDLVYFNPKDISTDEEFLNFFGNETSIAYSTNTEKVDELINCMNNSDVNAAIFSDVNLPYYAMAAFISKPSRIHRVQIASLLERRRAVLDYGSVTAYRILDDNGEFTKEAEELLIPRIKASVPVTVAERVYPFEKHREQITAELKKLPTSENLFYVPPKYVPIASIGAQNAIAKGRAGDNYVECLPTLGRFDPKGIWLAILKNARLAAANHPNTFVSDDRHGDKVTPTLMTQHDKDHRDLLMVIPRYLRDIKIYIKELLTRTHHSQDSQLNKANEDKLDWSSGLWDFIDHAFEYQPMYNDEAIRSAVNVMQLKTEELCNLLENSEISVLNRRLLMIKSEIPSTSIWIIVLDMLFNKAKWLQLGIDPAYLVGKLKTFYQFAEQYQKLLTNQIMAVQILKLEFFYSINQLIKFNKLNPNFLSNLTDESKELIQMLGLQFSDENLTNSTISSINLLIDDRIKDASVRFERYVAIQKPRKTHFISLTLNGFRISEMHISPRYIRKNYLDINQFSLKTQPLGSIQNNMPLAISCRKSDYDTWQFDTYFGQSQVSHTEVLAENQTLNIKLRSLTETVDIPNLSLLLFEILFKMSLLVGKNGNLVWEANSYEEILFLRDLGFKFIPEYRLMSLLGLKGEKLFEKYEKNPSQQLKDEIINKMGKFYKKIKQLPGYENKNDLHDLLFIDRNYVLDNTKSQQADFDSKFIFGKTLKMYLPKEAIQEHILKFNIDINSISYQKDLNSFRSHEKTVSIEPLCKGENNLLTLLTNLNFIQSHHTNLVI